MGLGLAIWMVVGVIADGVVYWAWKKSILESRGLLR
jgi:hypothetical protein